MYPPKRMRLRRFILALVGVVAAILVAALPATGKDGVEATLTSRIPLDAPAGSELKVAWTLFSKDENGRLQAFGASEIYVRLQSATGAGAETAWARGQAGNYVATVRVPQGGIGDVEIGIRGYVNGSPSDEAFPITNDPVPDASPVSPTRTSATAPETSELRGCRSRGEGTKPQQLPATPGVRLGPLVIWPTVRTSVDPTTSSDPWRFYVKAPIVLGARVRAVLAVAPEATGLVGMQGRGGGWVSAIRFQACRERTPAWTYDGTVGKHTGFPFGFGLARRSACIPMELWIDGQATPIRRLVPFGRRSC